MCRLIVMCVQEKVCVQAHSDVCAGEGVLPALCTHCMLTAVFWELALSYV